ncbi:MAG: MsnO8 family LLM class oxidoreductase [Pseudomonadota bacterium]
MSPALSVLDPSPIFEGQTGGQALQETRAMAQRCEALGYARYWVQEHHNTPCFASVAPEVLIADLAAHTHEISIGAGGVMLPNYSPLKVAEQFSTLSALHPGRIELGIGRATGADPRASAALLGPGAASFPTMLRLLMDWLLDASGQRALDADHRASGIHARPSAPAVSLWTLVSSPETAAFAGAMGLRAAFADFLAPGGAAPALAAYREAFSPSAFAAEPYCAVAYTVLAAPSAAAARVAAAPAAAWNIARAAGHFAPFPKAAAAKKVLERAGPAALKAAEERMLIGTAAQVAAELTARCAASGADEAFLLTIAASPEARAQSYRLIAEAAGLSPRGTAGAPIAAQAALG